MAANGHPTVAAILVAAGAGERLGADLPKAFVPVAGTSLLVRAFTTFRSHPDVTTVVVVAPRSHVVEAAQLTRAPVVVGGETRQASVGAGIAALTQDVDFVLVHDVARAFVPASVIAAVVAALVDGADAVVPVVPVHDTVRRIGSGGELDGIVDRSSLVAVQTPQGFRRDVLAAAHEHAEAVATDDAALVEALGYKIVCVPGADEAFKITTPADLARAEALVLGSAPSAPTTGGTP